MFDWRFGIGTTDNHFPFQIERILNTNLETSMFYGIIVQIEKVTRQSKNIERMSGSQNRYDINHNVALC